MTRVPSLQPDTVLEMPALASTPSGLSVRTFGLTDRGKERPSNEDHFLVAELSRALWVRQSSLPQSQKQYGRNRGYIFLVADGMGGHQAGEVASALGISTIEGFVLHVLKRFSNLEATDEPAVVKDFQTALYQADARIVEEAALHPEFAGMGTTLTLAFVSDCNLFVLHAGDSRCYLYHSGQLRRLTRDHTLVNELTLHGVIKPEEARHHRLRHVVTNILGGGKVGVKVDVQKAQLESGDIVLLCSDGLTEMLDDDRITAILAAEVGPEQACRRLVAEANEAGGHDNITCIVGRLDKM